MEHLRLGVALPRLAACAGRTAVQLARRRIRFPRRQVGRRVRFADGSTARIYCETVMELSAAPLNLCVLIV